MDYTDLVAKSSYNIALVYKDRDQFDQAEKAFRGALATWEGMVRAPGLARRSVAASCLPDAGPECEGAGVRAWLRVRGG